MRLPSDPSSSAHKKGLTHTPARVQRGEEAAAQFKKWLKALSDHSRNLLGAKAALVAAETTLKVHPLTCPLFLLLHGNSIKRIALTQPLRISKSTILR